MSVTPVKSPCIKVCVIDGSTGWCLGCARTLKEISQWTKYTDQQRDAVIDESEARLETLREMGKLG